MVRRKRGREKEKREKKKTKLKKTRKSVGIYFILGFMGLIVVTLPRDPPYKATN